MPKENPVEEVQYYTEQQLLAQGKGAYRSVSCGNTNISCRVNTSQYFIEIRGVSLIDFAQKLSEAAEVTYSRMTQNDSISRGKFDTAIHIIIEGFIKEAHNRKDFESYISALFVINQVEAATIVQLGIAALNTQKA